MNREILRIALPAIVTNITVPLLGLVDTAIVGHMGAAMYMGAIAVGSMMFNLIYWVFGFLRMGTSGLTAQAYGRGDSRDTRALLRQSLLTALGIAGGLVVLQWPLRELMLWFIGPTPDVLPLAVTYFNIVIWGAPAMLGLYAMSGWFIGMQDTRTPMFISILQNVVNILASLILVYGFDMKVEGVAWGTVIAQYAGAAVALWKVGTSHSTLNPPPSTFNPPPSTLHTSPIARKRPQLKERIGVSFGNILQKEMSQIQQEVVEELKQEENTCFTDDDLQFQWLSMCNRMPEQYIGMANRMKSMMPVITEFPAVEVVVDNELVAEELNKIRDRVLITLQKNLHNTTLTLNIRVAEPKERHKVLSRREQYEELEKKNPSVAKLREIFELELA